MTFFTNVAAIAVAGVLALTAPAFATTLKITSEDGEVLATFDRSSIEALGLQKVETVTPWTDGNVVFEGVSLKKILAETGVGDASVTGLALDDYAASLSSEIIEEFDPIVATQINGVPMTVDNKGPFWIMFDFDDIPSELSIEMRSLAVWHLIELELE